MNESRGDGPGPNDVVARYSASLQSFLEEVSATLEELREEVPGVALSMKKKPDDILALLPRDLEFEQMSLLEIQYVLPGTSKRPGIRFWLEGPRTRKSLRAVLFEDTVIWDVSYSLEKLYTELGSFSLGSAEIVTHPAPLLSGEPGADSDWKGFLRTVLRFPIPCATAKEEARNV
jgi:hypothetical protein